MEDLRLILKGQAVEKDEVVDVIDKSSESFVPITKQTVHYIVSGLLFNEAGEILMMQEAKSSCYGYWYLPAGRMETNESIEEAVIREVQEETGIVCQPVGLTSVEITFNCWFRFNMICSVTGGKLKTTKESDKESLQAQWFPVDAIMHGNIRLRSSDIIPIIKIGVESRSLPSKCLDLLPAPKGHLKLLLRLVIAYTDSTSQKVSLVIGKKSPSHLPTCSLLSHQTRANSLVCFAQVMMNIFGSTDITPDIRGILSVEHCGRPSKAHDGICLTILVVLDCASQPKIANSQAFLWEVVSDIDLAKELTEKCQSGSAVPALIH